jgi:glycosyltransferase involved in cell wall biosynthesis
MSIRKIVGIVLVKNEDVYIDRVLTNVLDFCDEIIVSDNLSTDDTTEKIKSLARQHSKIEYHRIDCIACSHDLISGYAGKNVWVFGVDGDEIYDPVGLVRFRKELLAGKYDNWWMIFGSVLHCTEFDSERKKATGHIAPPCRSMTKLYNFGLIESWYGSSGERLHGGDIVFKEGFGKELRYELYKEVSWDESVFRCLHMCFLQRSSGQKSWKGQFSPRQNPADILSQTPWQSLCSFIRKMLGVPVHGKKEWKIDKYSRGPVSVSDVSGFFSSA